MDKQASYLIIGNGITGITAAEILRSEDPNSSIAIVADDPSPVYYRPALKDFLGGHISKDLLWARPNTFYQNYHIQFIPGRMATISPARHTIQLQNGEQYRYTKLLLANGAHPRQLDCRGTHLAGVSTLRSIADYQEILRKLPTASRIVICGSGTLAIESAETLRKLGYQVTHLLRKQTLWAEILDQTASDMVLQEERRAGVDVRTNETIAEIIGKQGQVTEVVTSKGTRLPCDILLIAIGIVPNIGFIQTSGIACGQGVKVDTTMRTNIPDIYAAGDVIETINPLTGQTRVIGQWFPSIQQARTAAYSMLNNRRDRNQSASPLLSSPIPSGTFYNATSLCGLDFVAIGITLSQTQTITNSSPYQEIIADPAPRSYRKVLLKDGIPVGALFLGERKHALAFKRAIDARVNLSSILPNLFSNDFQFDVWLDKQNIPEAIFESRDATVSQPSINVSTSGSNQPRLPTSATESVQRAYLIPIEHPKVQVATRETQLSSYPNTTLIGRQPEVTLFIEHSSISRKHAEISQQDERYILQDLGSSNGTFVNTLPLPSNESHILQSGDKIRFGDVQFQFQMRTQPANATDQYQHILGSPLERNTVRSVPEAILATLRNTPSLILLMKDARPKIVPLASEQLTDQQLTIGRDTDNVITLSDTAASRKHAALFEAPDGLYIRDLTSSNGVFVNKVRINNAYHLSHGDRVVIGNTLIYCYLPNTLGPTNKSLAIRPPAGARFLAPPERPAQPVITIGHRQNIQPLAEKRIQFEIDMCIGCNRCMAACPLPLSTQMSISDLNQATISNEITSRAVRFTNECIMCGACVPVCPVDNHRDLLMLSLKQRIGSSWDSNNDMQRIADALPAGWSVPQLVSRLREQPILSNEHVVPENYLLHLFKYSQLRSLDKGITLIREGEYGRDLYILMEGRLSISATKAKGKELQVGIIKRGEYTGEYGMLTGQPSPTTVVTLTPALVLQVPEQVIQRFMELVPRMRTFFEQLNNARSIEGILKRMALFQGISDTDIHVMVEQTCVHQYDRDECLFSENGPITLSRQAGSLSAGKGRPARETLHILLEGFVKVARLKTDATGLSVADQRIIAYRQGGDYFAGGLDLLGDGRAVTVTSITRARVAEVPRSALLTLFKRYPDVAQRFTTRLHQYIESTASAQSRVFEDRLFSTYTPQPVPADSTVRAGLHSLISNGVIEGTEVLVIDLDKCIHCNECEEACGRRHGQSRMNRKGMVVGNISVATACRQCQDPVCLLCSRAGIARRPDGEVFITESCIGCGICAERCPYGAISIVDLEEQACSSSSIARRFNSFFAKSESKERTRKHLPMATATLTKRVSCGPLSPGGYDEMRKKVAIKCDLCAGYNDQACVQACPTGAAIRIHPTKFFGSTEEILHRKTY